MRKVNVARDFTRFPTGRLRKLGSTSGQEFRERFLEDAIRKKEVVLVELDGTVGYGSSFLEEAFGGIVRSLNASPEDVLSFLKLESSDESLVSEIIQYIRDAAG